MKLLHIDAGITGPGAASRQISAAIVENLVRANPRLEVVRRDLDAEPIPHLDSRNVAALGATDGDALEGEAARAAAIVQEFLDADVVVLGAPMYNLGIPSLLKAWFDRILVAGKTFRYTVAGVEGLAGDKTVIIASARGGLYAPGTPQAAFDFHEPYLSGLFGFIGVKDVTVVRAEGLNISPELRESALKAALASAAQVSGAPALAA